MGLGDNPKPTHNGSQSFVRTTTTRDICENADSQASEYLLCILNKCPRRFPDHSWLQKSAEAWNCCEDIVSDY